MLTRRSAVLLLSVVTVGTAHAEVSINTHQTKNMVCSHGVCSPTAKGAYLNVHDLQTMLQSGDVKVATGAGAVTLGVDVPLTWSSNHRLTLDAIYRVAVKAPVSVTGKGSVSIIYNDGGSGGDLLFFNGGKIDFWDLGSAFTVNGQQYRLFGDLPTLISDVVDNPSGAYALANDYDASGDGTYSDSPIPVEFEGNFEGAGHRVLNLSVKHSGRSLSTGFFYRIGTTGTVRDIGIINASMDGGRRRYESVGGLVGVNSGTIAGAYTSGAVKSSASRPEVGGLVGVNGGTILHSHSDSRVTSSGDLSECGGLVGWSAGLVQESYATGAVKCARGFSGGLVGQEGDYILHKNKGVVLQSYATGAVNAAGGSDVGGFAGLASDYAASETYSTGAVGGDGSLMIGGWVGDDYHKGKRGHRSANYWDLDTSGISDPSQGAGSVKNDSGITGLTDTQLKSGLPNGFNPDVWSQDAAINNGYPYLRANPPQ